MAEIISINGNVVKIGNDSGDVVSVPIASLGFANPQVGDGVKIYKDGDSYIVRKIETKQEKSTGAATSTNKHVFVWVFCFLLGGFGVDRFIRGQVGTGICKLLFGWLTLGIWPLVDWIIAMTKAYGSAFGSAEEVEFDATGRYLR